MGRNAQGVREYFAARSGATSSLNTYGDDISVARSLESKDATSMLKDWVLSSSTGGYYKDSARVDNMYDLLEAAHRSGGIASDIATTVERSERRTDGGGREWRVSEKQAYAMARGIAENQRENPKIAGLLSASVSAKQKEKSQKIARQKKYDEYEKTYKRSSTKVSVGSQVTDSKGRKGVISEVITPSSGYVTVRYNDGTTRKQMAFNLYGDDGNPLKKKPKR